MHTRLHSQFSGLAFGILLAFLLASAPGGPRRAQAASGQAVLSLTAAPEVILADGHSNTMVSARVYDSDGNLAPDGTVVQFSATDGTLGAVTATTIAGMARVSLTSTTSDTIATVSATAFVGSSGGASNQTRVQFTTDHSLVFSSPDALWIQVECPQYLIYSTAMQMIEADGRFGSARFRYKALSLTADAFQIDLKKQTILARNAVLQRGHAVLHADLLKYNYDTGDGNAVAETGPGGARSVVLKGAAFEEIPVTSGSAQYYTEVDIYHFADLSPSRMIVAARAMSVDPGHTIQFRRASIYADGRKVLSLPYQVMPLSSDQLLGHQLLGFTPNGGLALEIPFYYHVDPHSTGTLFLRNSIINNDGNATPLDATGTRPTLALDLDHKYALADGGAGDFSVTGITSSIWGAHWDHMQNVGATARSFTTVDYPDHRALLASTQLTRQFTGFSLNMTASGNRDPGLNGYSSSSLAFTTSLAGNPYTLGRSGFSLIPSLAVQRGQYTQNLPGQSQEIFPVSTQTLEMLLSTKPLQPDAQTRVTDAFTVGESWGDSGQTDPTMELNLGLKRDLPLNSHLGLNYLWRYDPLFSQLGTDPTGDGLLGTVYHSALQQRLTVSFDAAPSKKIALAMLGGYDLPLNDSNLYSSLTYRVNSNWGLGAGLLFDRYLGDTYRETLLTVSRRVWGRDLALSYSTLTRKLRFNFAGFAF